VNGRRIERLTRAFAKKRATVFYDGHCVFCTRIMRVIKTLDTADRVTLVDFRKAGIERAADRPSADALASEMHLQKEDGGWERGFFAFRYLVRVVPALYVFAPLMYFPFAGRIGPKAYRFVADRRFSLFGCGCGGATHRAGCPLARQTNELSAPDSRESTPLLLSLNQRVRIDTVFE
jgi:predicted DCC family thiol-disulfide oxidoreductase YuxK